MVKVWVGEEEDCEGWCNAHNEPIHECSCPAVETWIDVWGDFPYDITVSPDILAWLRTPEGTFTHDDEDNDGCTGC